MNIGRLTGNQVAQSIEYEKLSRDIQKYVLTFFNESELRNTALVNKNFKQLSHEAIADLKGQCIVAYRYRATVANDWNDAIHGGKHDIIEFFIPSLNLCFNNEYVYTSDKPYNHIGSPFLSESKTSPLTKKYLAPSLVDTIKQVHQHLFVAEKDEAIVMEKLQTDEEYQVLFKRPIIVKEGEHVVGFLKDNDDNFQAAYKVYGNDAVLQEILKYISGKKYQETSPLDDLVRIIKRLDTLEKESLKAGLFDKTNTIENEENSFNGSSSFASSLLKWVAPCAVGGVAGLKAEALTKNTLFAFTTGVGIGALTFFAGSACKDHLTKKQQTHQEEMKEFFSNLLNKQSIKLFDTKRNTI